MTDEELKEERKKNIRENITPRGDGNELYD